MFGSQYYHGIIRKYVVSFGNLFNDIVVVRKDSANNRIQTVGVPIAYGPKQKWLVRLTKDPYLDPNVAITVPRIGFEISSIVYSPTRKLSSTIKNVHLNAVDGEKKWQYVPVPYDIYFTLSIFSKNADDAAQILEQILPYFRPEYTTNVKILPEMDIVVDTPVELQSISIEDVYEADFQQRRILMHTIEYVVKAYMFGPVYDGSAGGIIRRAIVYTHDKMDEDALAVSRVAVTPSLYANGAPLFSPPDDPNDSIPIANINPDDDYGFTVDINENVLAINEPRDEQF
jgi:hypothetical protein